MVEMDILGVRIELPTNQPLILLKEKGGERVLPIWIGVSEAVAIALKLQDVKTARPMTHDLLKDILETMDVKAEKVVIDDIVDGTFYATLTLIDTKNHYEISSRPSDAIALAVRTATPVFVEDKVLDEASIVLESIEEEVKRFRDFLDEVGPEDFT
ncbi:MAG: bifunctional nuclease family protein [Actinomycetota bacterium]